MPIRPENKKYYTARSGWPLIRAAIMQRAKYRCEWDGCGVENHLTIRVRKEKKTAYDPDDYKNVVIVLTIAHLNQDPTDNRAANLKALCQLHHNQLDAKWRAKGIRDRRHAKAGQEKLL